MKITYIGHSGFLVELEDKALLFDYYEGEIPKIRSDMPLYIFVSHKHGDHYNRDVLEFRGKREHVTYIFSKDIMTGKRAQELGIIRLLADQTISVDDMRIQTLRSNDEGVAFLIHANDKVLYHAGDLNWWHWEGEPDEDNRYMEISYKAEIAKIQSEHIDAAFVVLDPRQEEQFHWGFDWFMRHTDTKHIIPMHMWGEYDWIEKLKAMPESESYREKICAYEAAGENFYLE